MHELAAAGPSPVAVSLIVGMGVSTWVAVLAVVGWFARRFMDQQRANHQDTQETLRMVRVIESELPAVVKRVKRLERGHRQHSVILDRMSWVLEMRERETTGKVSNPGKNSAGKSVRTARQPP
jgi:hypothetical protein